MARVSVIIPTHNRAALVPHAVASAKRAGTDVEVIVVDDASTDHTATVCGGLANVIYLRQAQNMGPSHARNAGIARSTSEFITFLDDDDLRLPNSIDTQADVLSRDESLGFVYGRVLIGDPKTCKPTGDIRPNHCPTGDIFWELLRGNFIHIPSVLVRRRALEAAGWFDPGVRPGTEDWDVWLRLAESHGVAAVHEPVAIYRDFTRGSGQISSNRPRMCRSSAETHAKALRLPRAMATEPGFRRELHLQYMNFLWDDLIAEANESLSEHRFSYAMKNYLTAFQLCPMRALRPHALKNFMTDIARSFRTKLR